MSTITISHDLLSQHASFNQQDIHLIQQRRRPYNQLGFGYQLAFVRIANRFPAADPFEVIESVLQFVSVQLDIPTTEIDQYGQRQPTISDHRHLIQTHLSLASFGDVSVEPLEQYLFEEACRLEQTIALINQAKLFLRRANILEPANAILKRIVMHQRQAARTHIYTRIDKLLTHPLKSHLDTWLKTTDTHRSPLFKLKQSAGRPTPKAMNRARRKPISTPTYWYFVH